MTTAGLQDVQFADSDLVSMLVRITSTTPELCLRNHDAVLKLTEELFPGAKIDVEETADPEIEHFEHIAILVTAKGEVPELVARDGEWHSRLCDIAPETARYYCLSLSVA